MMRIVQAGLLAALLCLVALPARADGGVTLTRNGDLIDVNIDQPMAVDEVVAALAESFHATVKGSVAGATVGPLRLVQVSLSQALAQILPEKAFVLSYAGGAATPSAIILATAPSGGGGSAPPPQMFAPPQTNLPGPHGPSFAITAQQRAACLMRRSQMKPGHQGGGGQEGPKGDPCVSLQLTAPPVE
jgi:hypothetical protein